MTDVALSFFLQAFHPTQYHSKRLLPEITNED